MATKAPRSRTGSPGRVSSSASVRASAKRTSISPLTALATAACTRAEKGSSLRDITYTTGSASASSGSGGTWPAACRTTSSTIWAAVDGGFSPSSQAAAAPSTATTATQPVPLTKVRLVNGRSRDRTHSH